MKNRVVRQYFVFAATLAAAAMGVFPAHAQQSLPVTTQHTKPSVKVVYIGPSSGAKAHAEIVDAGNAAAPAQQTSPSSQTAKPSVEVFYLVPSDRVEKKAYADGIANAIRHVEEWYNTQVNGKTFLLNKPAVAEVDTAHNANWYATNPVGSDPSLWFFFNAVADAFALTGASFNDPQHRYIFYIDADPACGQVIGAAAGVAVLAANDLRGLTDGENIPACPLEPPDTGGVCRWVGGLGHELGHTFGLAHPEPCPGGSFDDELMCLGYITYPNTYLSPDQESLLAESPFFFLGINLHPGVKKKFGCPILSETSR